MVPGSSEHNTLPAELTSQAVDEAGSQLQRMAALQRRRGRSSDSALAAVPCIALSSTVTVHGRHRLQLHHPWPRPLHLNGVRMC